MGPHLERLVDVDALDRCHTNRHHRLADAGIPERWSLHTDGRLVPSAWRATPSSRSRYPRPLAAAGPMRNHRVHCPHARHHPLSVKPAELAPVIDRKVRATAVVGTQAARWKPSWRVLMHRKCSHPRYGTSIRAHFHLPLSRLVALTFHGPARLPRGSSKISLQKKEGAGLAGARPPIPCSSG